MRDGVVRILSKLHICGIYMIKNNVNNKIYIGQSVDIERRWCQHKYGKGNIILKNAILKYGIENFNFEILETVDVTDKNKSEITNELTILEQKWFDIKKPYEKEIGYNIQKLSKQNLTPNRDKYFGAKISKIKIDNNHMCKPLNQYDFNGKFIKEWKSAAQIERELGFKSENISACCLGKQKTSNGFIWKFIGEIIDEIYLSKLYYRKRIFRHRKVSQYSMTGEFIKTFESISLAAKEIGIHVSNIIHTCAGTRKSSHGYKWSYAD